jgi:hypothetical protein
VLSPFILSISIIYRTFLKGSTSFKIFCSYVVSLCLFSKLSSFLHDCHSTNWRQLFTNWDALFELLFFWCRFVRKGDAVVVCCEGLIEAHILSSLWLNKQVKRHPSGHGVSGSVLSPFKQGSGFDLFLCMKNLFWGTLYPSVDRPGASVD